MKLKSVNHRSDEFQWIGEGIQKDRRRKHVLDYETFKNGRLIVNVGDHVTISNDDAPDPESIDECYIARVIRLYDNGDDNKNERFRAIVQWYLRPAEIKKYKNKNLPPFEKSEIILDERNAFETNIDAETIFQKCEVKCISLSAQVPSSDSGRLQFFTRWQFNGIKFTAVNVDVITPSSVRARRSLFYASAENSCIKINSPFNVSEIECLNESNMNESSLNNRRKQLNSAKLSISSKKNNQNSKTSSKLKSQNNQSTKANNKSPIKNFYSKRSQNGHKLFYSTPIKIESKDCSTDEFKGKISIKELLNHPLNELLQEEIENLSDEENSLRHENKNSTYNSDSNARNDSKGGSRKYNLRKNRKVKDCYSEYKNGLQSAMKLRKRNHISDELESSQVVKKLKQEDSYDKKDNTSNEDISSFSSSNDSNETYEIISSDNHHREEDSSEDSHTKKQKRKSVKRMPSICIRLKRCKIPSEKKKTNKSKSHETSRLQQRSTPREIPKNSLEQARLRLHVSAIPKSLPCREEEFEQIYTFIKDKLSAATSGCMYISGVPGTGKTATVFEVIRCLNNDMEIAEIPHFQFISVNGMKLTEPSQAYVQIAKTLTGQKLTAESAINFLEKRFSQHAPRRETVVLFVDELDQLWTKRQDVLYNLFDWPTRPKSKLIVIAIANTMNLPERIMMNRVVSRMGMTRLIFQPYSHQQLQTIITARLTGLEAFDRDVIQLISRKVAAISGDARRALDICQRAIEIAELSSKDEKRTPVVTMLHVDEAIQEMFSSPKVAALINASFLEKLLIKAVVGDFKENGMEETTFSKVLPHFKILCRLEGISPPNNSEALAICSSLGSSRILLLEHGRKDIIQGIHLNVSLDDVHYALKDLLTNS